MWTLQQAQYTCGVGTPILEAPALKLPRLESKWLQGLRFYLNDVGGLIRLDDPGVPSLQRHHDQYLMDMVLADPKWKPIEIKRINWCRLYLNVTTLSDITNAQGHQLDPGIYYGNLENPSKPSAPGNVSTRRNRITPAGKSGESSAKPSPTLSPITSTGTKLYHPLGSWTVPEHSMRRQWPHWYDPIQGLLFQKHSRHYTAHRKLKHDYDMEPSHTCPSLPASAVPVDVTVYAHTWKVHSHYVQWDLPASRPSSDDIQTLAPTLAEWEQPY